MKADLDSLTDLGFQRGWQGQQTLALDLRLVRGGQEESTPGCQSIKMRCRPPAHVFICLEIGWTYTEWVDRAAPCAWSLKLPEVISSTLKIIWVKHFLLSCSPVSILCHQLLDGCSHGGVVTQVP